MTSIRDKYTEFLKAEMTRLAGEGKGVMEATEALGLSYQTAVKYAKSFGISFTKKSGKRRRLVEKKVMVPVHVDKSLHGAIKGIANARGVSVSNVVRDIIKSAINIPFAEAAE